MKILKQTLKGVLIVSLVPLGILATLFGLAFYAVTEILGDLEYKG